MKKTLSHIHKLKMHRYPSGNKIFHCTLPECFFKLGAEFATGKRAICWRCGKDFILDEITVRLEKPHCRACTKTRVKREISVNELLNHDSPEIFEPPKASLLDRLAAINNPVSEEDNDI